MIGLIMVVVGIFLIVLGFLFTIFGSRKLSESSSVPDLDYGEYQQYDGRSGHENGVDADYAGVCGDDPSSHSTVKGGGVIMIGPIPIIFGSGRKSSEITIIFAVILMLLWFLLFR